MKFLFVGLSMKNFDDFLNPYYIRDSLSIESKLLVPVIQVHENIASTNDTLLEKNCIYPNGHICMAENQTQGRGVSGHNWVAAKRNICFSAAWNFNQPIKQPHMLNYFIAINLIKSLVAMGYKGIKAKWPNDLTHNGFKLAGTLIDMVHKKDAKVYLVVGVGLNVEISKEDKKNINQNATDLLSVNSKNIVDRNKIAAALIDAVVESLSTFENCDYKKLSEDWNNIDYNYSQLKTILINKERIKAKLMGINELGQLRCFYGEKTYLYNINEVKIIKDEFLCD